MVFGAGEGGRRALSHLRDKADVICVLDNDARKHGQEFHGVTIAAPSRATEEGVDQILIASIYSVEIFDQLLTLGVDVRKIDVLEHEFLQDFATFPSGIRNLLVAGSAVAAMFALWLLAW
jgi:FlaA1/EpsC-like NDP-sugar epimerase